MSKRANNEAAFELSKLVAHNIAVERIGRKLSQGDLARKADLAATQTIMRIESGNLPSLNTFVRIANALDVHPAKLLL